MSLRRILLAATLLAASLMKAQATPHLNKITELSKDLGIDLNDQYSEAQYNEIDDDIAEINDRQVYCRDSSDDTKTVNWYIVIRTVALFSIFSILVFLTIVMVVSHCGDFVLFK